MLLIMMLNYKGKFYRVYYDTKYNDYIILTPSFGTTRFIPRLPFDDETKAKIEKRIAEVEEVLKVGDSRLVKCVSIKAT